MESNLVIKKKSFVDEKTGNTVPYYSFVARINGVDITFKPSINDKKICNFLLDKCYKE